MIEAPRFRVDPNGKTPLAGLGLISCGNRVHLRHVPFYEPCAILVLSGRKTLFAKSGAVVCDAGSLVTVPGHSSLDLRNDPDPGTRRYRALILPFGNDLFARMCRAHGIGSARSSGRPEVLSFECDHILAEAVMHYLRSIGDAKVVAHRLMEILLILSGRDARLAAYALDAPSWAQRVRAVVAADLARAWDLDAVCGKLATSESTLRRNLKKEKTSFRELRQEQRLSSALMLLLQSTLPVGRIAYDCGYQSVSRFSSNFRKRFGVPPTRVQESNGAGPTAGRFWRAVGLQKVATP
jgi:AraC-like DNA-binding protein